MEENIMEEEKGENKGGRKETESIYPPITRKRSQVYLNL